jgi:hypothetical protein
MGVASIQVSPPRGSIHRLRLASGHHDQVGHSEVNLDPLPQPLWTRRGVVTEEILLGRDPKVDATERRREGRHSSGASLSVTAERVAKMVFASRVDIDECADESGLEFPETWFGRGVRSRGSRGPSTLFHPHFSDSPQVQNAYSHIDGNRVVLIQVQ